MFTYALPLEANQPVIDGSNAERPGNEFSTNGPPKSCPGKRLTISEREPWPACERALNLECGSAICFMLR